MYVFFYAVIVGLFVFFQMLAFFQTVFTFYHQGFELAKDFEHYKRALQINIQNVRNSLILLLGLKWTFLQCSSEDRGCCRSMFNMSSQTFNRRGSVGVVGSELQHYTLIFERLEWISKGEPVIFDLQQLRTRAVSTQPRSTRK